MGLSEVNAARHRRAARVKRLIERFGVDRLPGYDRLADRIRAAVFPGLSESDGVVLRVEGLLLEVPRRFVPHYLHRAYEPATTRAFMDALRPRGVVVDVGAHIGYFTCLAGSVVGPAGQVHAIEPAPENIDALRRNLAHNDLHNVQVHAVAAAGVAGERVLHVTESSDSHGLHSHPLTPTVALRTVTARPVGELVAPPVGVVKVDVEGAEFEVLEGMAQLLAASPGATVLVEWNPATLRAAGSPPADLPALLEALGIRDLAVLDDHRPGASDLAVVLSDVERDALPDDWHANLIGTMT